jgi:RND family efflux transporter MFP subunit
LPLVVALAAVLFACGGDSADEGDQAQSQRARPVKMLTLEPAGSMPDLQFPAVIRSSRSAELSFNVPGVITEMNAVEGDSVEKGQVIARLDSREFKLRVESDQASFDLAQSEFERAEKLLQADVIAAAELDRLKAELERARAALSTSRKALEDATIRAPFNGVVSRRLVENFENVQAKQPIVLMQSMGTLEVVIDVPEPLVQQARRSAQAAGQAMLRFDSQPDRMYPVTFKEFSTEADAKTQTFQAVFSLERPEDINVLPGMTATVVVQRRTAPESGAVFILPPLAVVADQDGGNMVWVFDQEQGQAVKREVQIGVMRSDGLEVVSGLETGERVIVSGVAQLHEGMAVRPH